MDRDFVFFIVLFFNCLGVYFIVRSGTGPWARVGMKLTPVDLLALDGLVSTGVLSQHRPG